MKAVLLEMEMIINNRSLTHLYPDTTETPLTPNNLVFARFLNHTSSNDRSINDKVFVEGEIQKLSRLMEHFWDRWRKEYVVNLREYHSTKQKVSSNPMIKLKDLVLARNDCAPRYLWRTGVVTELYYSNLNNQIRGASVRLNRSEQTIKRSINKLYPLEIIEEKESKGNEFKDMSRRPYREAAVMGQVKRRYGHF